MRGKPEKGRLGTLAPSHPATKCFTTLPARAGLDRLAQFRLRKPGARESARNLEVGGCGGHGCQGGTAVHRTGDRPLVDGGGVGWWR